MCVGISNEGGELGRAEVCYGEQVAGRELLGGCGVAAGLHSHEASQSGGGGAEGEHCGFEMVGGRLRLGEGNCKFIGRNHVYCGVTGPAVDFLRALQEACSSRKVPQTLIGDRFRRRGRVPFPCLSHAHDDAWAAQPAHTSTNITCHPASVLIVSLSLTTTHARLERTDSPILHRATTMDSSEEPWVSSTTPSSRPASQKSDKSNKSIRSARSSRSARSEPSIRSTEQTPLLARADESDDEEEEREPQTSATASLRHSLNGSSSGKTPLWKRRWPSILALIILSIAIVLILLGFLASEGIEEYAMQAADFKPTKLSLDSLTMHGIKVQIEGDFTMDASKVEKKSVRNLGRFGTWIAHEAETGATNVDVYLPDYGNILVGTAKVPAIKVNIRNGHTTHVSILVDLEPGSFDGIRNIANDWIEGRLGQIRFRGKAEVPLKSGLIHLGKQYIEESMVFKGRFHDLGRWRR
jgi:hypothetical protein